MPQLLLNLSAARNYSLRSTWFLERSPIDDSFRVQRAWRWCNTVSQQHHHHHQPHTTDSNTLTTNRETRSPPTIASDLNDLSGSPQSQEVSTPKTILRSKQGQVATGGGGKTVTIHSQPEIIQLQSSSSIVNALSNPCYFAGFNDTADQYDIERHTDNRVVISIRGGQIGHASTNNNNNNNENGDLGKEATKF